MMTRPPRAAARIGIAMVVVLHVSVLAHFGLRYSFLHFVSGGNLVTSIIVLIAYQSLYLAQRIATAAASQQQLAELTRRDTARLGQRA